MDDISPGLSTLPLLDFPVVSKDGRGQVPQPCPKGWPPNVIKQELLSRAMNHECPIKGRWRSYERAPRLGCSRRKEEEPPWLGKNLSPLYVHLQGASGALPHAARNREDFILRQTQAPFGFYAGALGRG